MLEALLPFAIDLTIEIAQQIGDANYAPGEADIALIDEDNFGRLGLAKKALIFANDDSDNGDLNGFISSVFGLNSMVDDVTYARNLKEKGAWVFSPSAIRKRTHRLMVGDTLDRI